MTKLLCSTKTYEHSVGLSCCFRQHRAESHCRFLHGYALQIELQFLATKLDGNGWVMDFGGLKHVKDWLHDTFDHKTLVAQDDPLITKYEELRVLGLIQLRVVKATGCEAFASMIFDQVKTMLPERVVLAAVRVQEHPGNSGIAYSPDLARSLGW